MNRRNFAPVEPAIQPDNNPLVVTYSYGSIVGYPVERETTGHYHWTINGFQMMGENGTFMDSITIVVEAPTEFLALKAAAKAARRNHYRVSSVVEVCAHELKE